jgi:hypothetical protein
MNNSMIHVFNPSSEYEEKYQKRTLAFISLCCFSSFFSFYCFLIRIIPTIEQVNLDSKLSDIISILNPLKAQEDYIEFLSIATFLAFFISIFIFWGRSKKLKYFKKKTLQITEKEIIQKFDQTRTHKFSWNQVIEIVLFKERRGEILYIEISEANNQKLRIFGVQPWTELVNEIQKNSKENNIKLKERNARIGAREYLVGSINLNLIFIIPIMASFHILKILDLELIINIAFFLLTFLYSIDLAFLSDPLESDRFKNKRSAILFFVFFSGFFLVFRWIES